jgi:Clp amino terminal domain, pathogenicity island component/ClpX C4-type zinc finger
VFEQFSAEARRLVVMAQESARVLNHQEIGTEHLLLGAVHDGAGAVAEILAALGITLEAVRAEVQQTVVPDASPARGHLPFSPAAKRVFEHARVEATTMGSPSLGAGHLLLGIALEEDEPAAHLLAKLGADAERLRPEVARRPEANPVGTAIGTGAERRALTIHTATASRGESCSFCGRDIWDVDRYVASSVARICGDCVEACAAVLAQAEAQHASGEAPLHLPPRVFGRRPIDDEAVKEVTQAFTMAIRGAANDEERAEFIEDGDALAPLLSRTGARYQQPIYTVVHAVRFVSEDRAQVRFGILLGTTEYPFTGDAVRLDGRWVVSRTTIGLLLAGAGVTIPPRSDGGDRPD